MVFSSSLFLFVFLPVLFFFYFLVKDRHKNMILLVASIFFYAWGEPKNVLLMLLSILINFVFGFLVEKAWKLKHLFFVSAVIYNIGMLFIFKYLNFFIDIINKIAGMKIQISEIALPIGISFYTFQVMSYIIDVYCGKIKAQKKLENLALYVALFPQLIAGPIVRWHHGRRRRLPPPTASVPRSWGVPRDCAVPPLPTGRTVRPWGRTGLWGRWLPPR